jgi:isopentenyl diphosphate isomerase/L-lactate dehydrogenase-like FMN-dependent dehydrogenase
MCAAIGRSRCSPSTSSGLALMNAAELARKGYSVGALRALARRQLPRMLFDMVDGAAGDEITMRRNEKALAEIALVPKLLAGAPKRDQSVELLGVKLTSPVVIGPTGMAGFLWPHAELAAARAAARFGTVYSTSHASTATMEAIAAATSGPKWMQVFLYKDRALTAEFAARAQAAGYQALILTVDNQVVAGRDRDMRNGLTFPLRWGPSAFLDFALRPGWLWRMRETPSPSFANYAERAWKGRFGPLMVEQLDPAVSWSDVEWLRKQWQGPLVIKGLLHPDEAREALRRGADAIVVSNHGGRQLDGAVASISALPGVVDAVGGAAPVMIDGGFRRGVDVVKALALGARAVLIGRPHLWGVACAGEDGVYWVLELFRREIDRALALGSWDDIAKLDRGIIFRANAAPN